jgi:hypothetical protein
MAARLAYDSPTGPRAEVDGRALIQHTDLMEYVR